MGKVLRYLKTWENQHQNRWLKTKEGQYRLGGVEKPSKPPAEQSDPSTPLKYSQTTVIT